MKAPQQGYSKLSPREDPLIPLASRLPTAVGMFGVQKAFHSGTSPVLEKLTDGIWQSRALGSREFKVPKRE